MRNMVIRIIDWEQHKIEEIEVEEVKFLEKGIEYPIHVSSNLINRLFVPYKNFLGIVK